MSTHSSSILPTTTHKRLLKVRKQVQERGYTADAKMNQRKSVPRTYKVLKRRVVEDRTDKVETPIEDDFLLETTGNEAEFLNSRGRFATYDPSRFKAKAWDIVGSKEGFEKYRLSLNKTTNIQQINKKVSPICSKCSSRILKKQSISPKENYEESFINKLRQVEESRLREKHENRRKITNLTVGDRLSAQRQAKVLESFEETNRTWEKIQDSFATRLNRPPENLAFNRGRSHREKLEDIEFIEKSLPTHERVGYWGWYMTLRSSGKDKKYSTHIPVGKHATGIFAHMTGAKKEFLEVIRRPGSTTSSFRSFKDDPYLKSRLSDMSENLRLSEISEFDDLVVHGISKLPLEIEAVKTVGIQNVRTSLIELGTPKEEVISKHYESKYRNMF
jgi:hypothetical protein